MSTSDSPVVVLVPGAWHSPSHFDHFTPYLKSAGFEVLSNRNPSCNSSNPTESSVAQDAEAIREKVIRPQVEAGRDVVVVMHSYGGVPGSAAAYGLSKVERAKSGLQGGIIGLIYVAAFTIDEGKTLMTCLPGETPDPWVVPGVSPPHLSPSNQTLRYV